jgi:hypothetical protein
MPSPKNDISTDPMFHAEWVVDGLRCEALTQRGTRCSRSARWHHLRNYPKGRYVCAKHFTARRGFWQQQPKNLGEQAHA